MSSPDRRASRQVKRRDVLRIVRNTREKTPMKMSQKKDKGKAGTATDNTEPPLVEVVTQALRCPCRHPRGPAADGRALDHGLADLAPATRCRPGDRGPATVPLPQSRVGAGRTVTFNESSTSITANIVVVPMPAADVAGQ
jgi:hypothetical protein